MDKKKICESLFESSDDPHRDEVISGVLLNLGVLVEDPAARMFQSTAAAWRKVVQTKSSGKRETRCGIFLKVVLRWIRYRFRADFFVHINIPDKKTPIDGTPLDLVPLLLEDHKHTDDMTIQMACSKIKLAMLRAGASSRALRAARTKKQKRLIDTRRKFSAPGLEQLVPGDEEEDASEGEAAMPRSPSDSPRVSPISSPLGSPSCSPRVSPRDARSSSSPLPAHPSIAALEAQGRGLVPSLSSYCLDEMADEDDDDESSPGSAPVSGSEDDASAYLRPGTPVDSRTLRMRSASMFSTMVVKGHSNVHRAQYITMIEADLFRAITPAELARMAWQKGDKEITSPNVLESLKFFNNLSFYVSHSVCALMEEDARAAVIKQHLQLAELCFGMGNFSTIMAVIGGLNNVAVQRMKKTWRHLGASSDKLWTRLNNLMDSKQNYAKYRSALGDFKSQKRPSVPFLGVFLRDVTFIEEGNEDYVDEKRGKLNGEKLQLLGQTMLELEWLQNQSSEYAFKTKKEAKRFWKDALLPAPENSDELLYEMSLTVVPRKSA